jgi:hypothetical protein
MTVVRSQQVEHRMPEKAAGRPVRVEQLFDLLPKRTFIPAGTVEKGRPLPRIEGYCGLEQRCNVLAVIGHTPAPGQFQGPNVRSMLRACP